MVIPLLDAAELVQHLLTDLMIKAVIVIAAAVVLIAGMVLLWRKLG